MAKRRYSIGIFDSGFGGLAILKSIIKKLPQYDYLYLADTARAPYGDRSQKAVFEFTRQAVNFLFKKNCWLVILACNTASCDALRKIQRDYLPVSFPERRVLGVIVPAAEAVGNKAISRVGVMATKSSVKSGVFVRELKKIKPDLEIFQQACPLIVPLIESGERNKKVINTVLQKYLFPLKKERVEAIILGCTHYGILENKIKEILGQNIKIISEGRIVAGKFKKYLRRHPEIEGKLSKNYKLQFFTTDLTDKFQRLGSEFFGQKIIPQKINLIS